MVWWKTNIYVMLQQIPSVASISGHFDRIESQLSVYEHLQTDIAPLLMLVIGKSTILDEFGKDEMRFDSESMLCLIAQNVLDFLCIHV